jgi:hypothetical protein
MAEAEAQAEALKRQQIITRMVEGAKVKTVADTEAEVSRRLGSYELSGS